MGIVCIIFNFMLICHLTMETINFTKFKITSNSYWQVSSSLRSLCCFVLFFWRPQQAKQEQWGKIVKLGFFANGDQSPKNLLPLIHKLVPCQCPPSPISWMISLTYLSKYLSFYPPNAGGQLHLMFFPPQLWTLPSHFTPPYPPPVPWLQLAPYWSLNSGLVLAAFLTLLS